MTGKPMRFLFATAHLGGNVSPIMPGVRRLVERGHSVRVLSDALNRPDAEAVGARFEPWRHAPSRSDRAREDDPTDCVGDRKGICMVAGFLAGTALAFAQDMREALAREPADLVVVFDMLLGPMLGCEAAGQKFAALGTSMSFFPLPGAPPLGSGLGLDRTPAERAAQETARIEFEAIFDSALPSLNAARAELGLSPLAHLADQTHAAAYHWLGTARAFDLPGERGLPRSAYRRSRLGAGLALFLAAGRYAPARAGKLFDQLPEPRRRHAARDRRRRDAAGPAARHARRPDRSARTQSRRQHRDRQERAAYAGHARG